MNAPTIKIEGSGAAAYIHIRVTSDTDGLATREYVESRMSAKLDANHGSQNAGKLMYIGADGTLIPLALGAGLEIRDGVLVVTGSAPETGEDIGFTALEDGSIMISGVEFIEQADGSVLLAGATFAEQADGSVLIG